MSAGDGWKRTEIWRMASLTNSLCVHSLRSFMMRTIEACNWEENISNTERTRPHRRVRTSVRCCLSSRTFSFVSLRSACVSTLAAICAILMRASGLVKFSLNTNLSPSEMSLPLGSFSKIFCFVHAKLCNVRFSSPSAIFVLALISAKLKGSVMLLSSKRQSTIMAKVETLSSCLRVLNCTRTSTVPRFGCQLSLRPLWRE